MSGRHRKIAGAPAASSAVEEVGRYTETDPETARPRTVRGRYTRRAGAVNTDPDYEGTYTDADSDPRGVRPDGVRGHYTESDTEPA